MKGFPWRGALLSLGLASLLVAAACGDDDDDTDTSADGTATATETASAEATGSATSESSPAAAETMEVTDLLGRKVEVPVAPERIVALSPTTVEYIYALGGEVVGRTSSVDYPPEAQQAEDVGGAYSPNPETILSLEPDLVVADSVIHADPQLRGVIEGLGVPTVFVGAASVDDVYTGLELLGSIMGAEQRATQVITGIEEAEASAKAAVGDQDISAIIVIGGRDASDRNVYAAKTDSYPGDIMERLGITNPASDLPDSGPFPGYATLPPDQLASMNPDYIFTLTPAPEPAPRLSTLIPMLPGADQLAAVQNGQVIELDHELFLQAPGPRVAQAFQALAAAVSGEGGAEATQGAGNPGY